ncbi:hypothetical protein Hrd1104_00810 [Halorhabdus sp. CBA1104]|uniref:hypothetical protein n=1 Tax=unclassified Halorhabdus TaxID=2621901 RepID=UPI0012B3D371|nr:MULTISPECIES: hypothetical protein [unclassified Halorhabdus]QGN05973.1 hypothetical protein Hrd1104_00810 [Halorhabdus sp. CBA1104]
MTSFPVDDELSDIEDFEQVLGQMLRTALEGDVDPRGSWVYRTGDGGPDFEVLVHELQSHDDAD